MNHEAGSRAELKRQSIIDAAWKVFAEQGFERTSMDAINTVCGCSKATLYKYFKSKDELFAEVVTVHAVDLTRQVYEILDDNRNIVETLHLFGRRYLDIYLNTDLMEVKRLVVAEGKNSDIGSVVYTQGFKKIWERMAAYLELHIPQERLLPGGFWTAAMQLKALLDGEAVIRRSWGMVDKVSEEEIRTLVEIGVTAFLRIYGEPSTNAG